LKSVFCQAASGSAFGTFALLHLGNIAAAHFQASGFNSVERIVRCTSNFLFLKYVVFLLGSLGHSLHCRYYYQNPILEPLLIIGSLGIHAISSYILVYRRWTKPTNLQKEPLNLSEILHRLTG
jgi:hypothetical protein